ncbi:MAG TPA: DUF4154 domain-containing protein [Bacteroidales bacterium]|jgi:hypothetical protein|nr:DUF4154 domain-containing protein [Bacteroidales bacterium]
MMCWVMPAHKQSHLQLSNNTMKRILFVLLLTSSFFLKSEAQEEKYIGLFVYNFTKYFDWPESAKQGDFIIQVLGHNSVYDELAKITSDKLVGTQKIRVESITSPEQIKEDVHILFLGHWQTRHLSKTKTIIADKPVLLVTEFEGLLQKGSVINFVIREGSIKFELSKSNAEAQGLQTDMRLVQLAYSVVE